MIESIANAVVVYTWYFLGVIVAGLIAVAYSFYKMGFSTGLQDGWRKGWDDCHDAWRKEINKGI